MDDATFKKLAKAWDRRGEDPSELDFDITDDAEKLAFDMHRMWCQEADQFGTPVEYAKYRLNGKMVFKPEPLRELLGGWPLGLLEEEKMARVVELAMVDGEVWHYLKKWFVDGFAGDPRPDLIQLPLVELIRRMVAGDVPENRSKPPALGITDEVLRTVATEIHNRFGCAPFSEDCLSALTEATGLSVNTVRDKLKDAGKGTSKKSYRKKKRGKKT